MLMLSCRFIHYCGFCSILYKESLVIGEKSSVEIIINEIGSKQSIGLLTSTHQRFSVVKREKIIVVPYFLGNKFWFCCADGEIFESR